MRRSRTRPAPSVLTLILLVCLTVRCGDDAVTDGLQRLVFSLELDPDSAAGWVGDTLRFTLRVRGPDSARVDPSATWLLADPSVGRLTAFPRQAWVVPRAEGVTELIVWIDTVQARAIIVGWEEGHVLASRPWSAATYLTTSSPG